MQRFARGAFAASSAGVAVSPMEIRRFGPGHRRPDGPPGTQGVTGQVIHDDGAALVSELAFGRYAMITPHSNPNAALFIVISGGGYVQVGDEPMSEFIDARTLEQVRPGDTLVVTLSERKIRLSLIRNP